MKLNTKFTGNIYFSFFIVRTNWRIVFFSVILKFFSFISPTDIVDFNELSLSAWKLWVGDLCLEIMSQWSLPGNYESVISAWKLWVSDLCLEIMSQWYIKCITMFTNRNKNINFEAIVTSLSSSYQTLCDTSDNVCLNLQNWVILYDNRDDFFLLFDWFHIFFFIFFFCEKAIPKIARHSQNRSKITFL